MNTLADVLHPIDDSYFVTEFVEKQQMIHVPGARGKFAKLLDWNGFNRILARASMVRPECVVLRKDGRTLPEQAYSRSRPNHPYNQLALDPHAVSTLLRNGATLILNSAEELHEPLLKFVTSVERQLKRRVWTNLYAVWNDVPGGACHYDAHDVLVLQIYGRKRWTMFNPTFAFPISEPPPGLQPPETACCHIEVTDGDVLFVPRGWWHLPVPAGEPTLHVTVGLEPRTGLNLLRWLSRELEIVDALRAPVPLFGSDAHQEEYLRCFQDAVMRACRHSSLLDSYWESETPRRPVYTLPAAAQVSLKSFDVEVIAPIDKCLAPSPNGEWADIVCHSRVFRYDGALLPILVCLGESSHIAVSSIYSRFAAEFQPSQIDELLHDLSRNDLVTLLPSEG